MTATSILFLTPPQAITTLFPQLKAQGVEIGLAENLNGALAFVRKSTPCLVFTRTRLPGYRVEQLLAAAAETLGNFPPIVVLAEQGDADEAARLMDLGARDYWLEPLTWEKLAAVLPGDDSPQPVAATAAPPPAAGVEIIGRHQAVLRVLALARQVAPSKATVLISGESGTGKEKFARYIHEHSGRLGKPFVAINCAALPEHLLESELFGHEKGAFTGAINRKLGKFELASGGTLLLDEISEMDLGLQAKLLRVLQEGEIDRVGGVETVTVDVRVLATTNRRLEEYVAEGKFRQDLYYRLNVIPLKLPALSERGDDIFLLADWFVENFRKAYGLSRLTFSPEAREWMRGYEWPGNVRELQNLIERAVLLAQNGVITPASFLVDGDSWQPEDAEELEVGAAPLQPPTDFSLPGQVIPLDEMERHLILRSLDQTKGNRTQAADLLGISVRTLRNKLADYRKLGIEVP